MSGLLTASVMSGCASSDDDVADYPSLHNVPAESRPSLPVQERRQIVRGLIEERDQSRRQTAIVRGRSGLSTTELSPSAHHDVEAEDIIPDAPDSSDSFSLAPEKAVGADPVYRGGSQFDDGGLDDFIRQLKRDTNPQAPPPDVLDPASSDGEEVEETSFLLPSLDGRYEPSLDEAPIVLAAFAPAMLPKTLEERSVMLRLAANGGEQGFFCRWVGWSLAWSGVCIDETEAAQETLPEGDGEVGADIGDEARRLEGQPGAQSPSGAERSASGQTGSGTTEPRLSGDDAARAIEEFSDGTLGPVKSSLEKLRRFMRSRQSPSSGSSEDQRRVYPEATEGALENALDDSPPRPLDRPKQREDMVIDDGGERFIYHRTPAPAFKPTIPDEPVILSSVQRPASRSKAERPPRKPRARSGDLERELEQTANVQSSREGQNSSAASESRTPEAQVMAAAPAEAATRVGELSISTLEPGAGSTDKADEPQTIYIFFEPGEADVPKDVLPRLARVLADAEARGHEIHIIGEAGTNHLALRRATDIGAALVRLEATAEILEYDFSVIPGVDQVRLVVKPRKTDQSRASAEPSKIQP